MGQATAGPRAFPSSAAVLLAGVVLLAVLTLLASWIPARRAASIDPMVVLREE